MPVSYQEAMVWSGRKAFARSRWSDASSWDRRYSMSLGNHNTWRDEKKRLSRKQRSISMLYQLER